MRYSCIMLLAHLLVLNNQAHNPELLPIEPRAKVLSVEIDRWKNIDQRGNGPLVVPVYDIKSRPKFVAFIGNAASKVSSEKVADPSKQLTSRLVFDIEHPFILHQLEKTLPPIDFHAIEEVIQGKRASHTIRNKLLDGTEMIIARTDQKNSFISQDSDVRAAAKSFGYSDGTSTRAFTAGLATECSDADANLIGILAEAIMLRNKSLDAFNREESMMARYAYLRRLAQCQSLPRIILDQDVSLEKFLDVVRHQISSFYDNELRDTDQPNAPLLRRWIVAPIIKSTLRSKRIHSFEQIDRAQEQLAEGNLPIFAPSTDRSEKH